MPHDGVIRIRIRKIKILFSEFRLIECEPI